MAENKITDSAALETGMGSVGSVLRQYRREIGKTMKQVAVESGLTEGFISQVERGLSAPSLISLYKIARALGTSVETFLSKPSQDTPSMVSRSHSRPAYVLDSKEPAYEILQRGFAGAKLNSCITDFPVGYISAVTAHEGEDLVFVIEGEILYEVNGLHYHLKAGDILHFPSTLPHRALNVGRIPARELWIGTTPLSGEH